MFTIERMQRIRRILLEKKRVEVADLSLDFGLSESTIRRDLDKLEKEGFLHKTYGGAVLVEGSAPVAAAEPLEEEHEKIARVAAEMVSEGEAVHADGKLWAQRQGEAPDLDGLPGLFLDVRNDLGSIAVNVHQQGDDNRQPYYQDEEKNDDSQYDLSSCGHGVPPPEI